MKKIGKWLAVLTGCLTMYAPSAHCEVIVCKAQKSNGICAHPDERNQNKGGDKIIKVKDRQHYLIAGFDLSAAKGKEITGAVLYVKGAHEAALGPMQTYCISTIASDWKEGTANGDAEEGASCFNCAEYPNKKWNDGDFHSVAFGAGGSIKNSRNMDVPPEGWGACELDLPLVKALIDGKQFGIAIAGDPDDYKNYYLYGRRAEDSEPVIKVFVGEPVKLEAGPVKAAPKAQASQPQPAAPFNANALKSDGALVRSVQDDQKSLVFGFDDFEVMI